MPSKSRKFSIRTKHRRSSKRAGGKRNKRSRRTRRARSTPKVIYIQQQAPYPAQQQLPPPQQPQQGVFTWGDAGKLFAVDVGAIAVEKGIDEMME